MRHAAPRRLGLLQAAGMATVATLMTTAAQAWPVVTPFVPALSTGTGMAYHPTNHHIYYLEAGAGKMSKVSTANGVVTTIQTGLVHPDDIALWPGANYAYITTRVGELGALRPWPTRGRSWRAGWASRCGSNSIPRAWPPTPWTTPRAPSGRWSRRRHQDRGRDRPQPPARAADEHGLQTAFITEADRLVSVDLQTLQVTEIVGYLVDPWYMTWAADDHSALYLVDKEPGKQLHRIDLSATPATVQAIVPLPAGPSSVVRSANPDVLYVASKTVLSKISLSGGAGGPIITRLGFIPSTEIDPVTGQATTDPSYFFYVKNASFGGSVHVMLNFPGMLSSGAGYYKVFVDASPDIATWTNYRWV